MSAESKLLPVSVVIPTRNRPAVLRRTLESLARQTAQPAQIVLVDASNDSASHDLCVAKPVEGLLSRVDWVPARIAGAAAQRNQAMGMPLHEVVGFFDDDILFEPECVARLYRAITSDPVLGGVNAMITNQNYKPPGIFSHIMFRIMSGRTRASYAGCLLGPAVNLLPEDRDNLPETVPVEWLNTTCTLYRRKALPDPPFPAFFTGYSMMEDVTLSVNVGRSWKLANARTARIFHDSQTGDHKSDAAAVARMELVNRHYVMTVVLGRCGIVDYARLLLWELFQLFSIAVQERLGRKFWARVFGKLLAVGELFRHSLRDATR